MYVPVVMRRGFRFGWIIHWVIHLLSPRSLPFYHQTGRRVRRQTKKIPANWRGRISQVSILPDKHVASQMLQVLWFFFSSEIDAVLKCPDLSFRGSNVHHLCKYQLCHWTWLFVYFTAPFWGIWWEYIDTIWRMGNLKCGFKQIYPKQICCMTNSYHKKFLSNKQIQFRPLWFLKT